MSYNRILLKLSGETLGGINGVGLDQPSMELFAKQIASVAKKGVQVAIVIGGGNIFRGLDGSKKGFDRVRGDQMGMLATVINSVGMSLVIKDFGVKAQAFCPFALPMAKLYDRDVVLDYMAEGGVALISGGTGNPFFTTDSGAALRACELGCDAILKGTKVDGVYDCDPAKNPGAKKYDTISFDKALQDELHVMDMTAFALCRDNNMPIVVFNMNQPGMLEQIVEGKGVCTIVK